MDPREFSHAGAAGARPPVDGQPEYRLNVTLVVTDPSALWSAAAARAMAAPGMTVENVLDTIGPREAPCVADCIAMLALPIAVAGCAVDDVWIDALPGLPGLPPRAALEEPGAAKLRLG